MVNPLTDNAKKLRAQQTPHEYLLWGLLRDRRLNGYKFRRQFVIGPYIADFCCFEKKLIVELDGGGHAESATEIKDQIRDRYLKELGYRVLRFWNPDFDRNKTAVLEKILRALEMPTETPHPPFGHLLPKGEGKAS